MWILMEDTVIKDAGDKIILFTKILVTIQKNPIRIAS